MNNEALTTRLTECRQAKHVLQEIIGTMVSQIEELESHESVVVGNLRNINVRLHKTIDERDEHIEEIGNKNTELGAMVTAYRNQNIEQYSTLDTIRRDILPRTKELEAEAESMRMKIFYIEGREDLVTAELEHQIKKMEFSLDLERTQKDMLLRDLEIQQGNRDLLDEIIDARDERIEELEAELNEMSRDMSNRCVCSDPAGAPQIELLNVILEIVNPIIKSGEYSRIAPDRLLSREMWKLCRDVIAFRRKHNIMG